MKFQNVFFVQHLNKNEFFQTKKGVIKFHVFCGIPVIIGSKFNTKNILERFEFLTSFFIYFGIKKFESALKVGVKKSWGKNFLFIMVFSSIGFIL